MQVLHSNLVSVKLDDAALHIIKAAYAFVALQGEAVNKTIAMQAKKQRRRIKTIGSRVAATPEQLQGPEAAPLRRWWVYDSDKATKRRVELLPLGPAKPNADIPVGPKTPPMPHRLTTMASPTRLPARSTRVSDDSS